MTAYYNEIDPYAAQWLRNLIAAGHIAPGDVDERSIIDVRPDDLGGYDQCHFFAGIGGWSHALRLAGWPDDRPVWTGSCPCQPFSAAGKGEAANDERHLWPFWFPLIAERRPAIIFGEQVEAAIGWGWLDAVFADLEGEGYACGASVLPACGVGAPHIRNRLWFVADAQSTGGRTNAGAIPAGQSEGVRETERPNFGRSVELNGNALDSSPTRAMAYPDGRDTGAEGVQRGRQHRQQPQDRGAGELVHAKGGGFGKLWDETQPRRGGHADGASVLGGFWSDAEWIACTDGKARPIGPGTFPLGHGIHQRPSKLRAYGNAIVPQVAAEFIVAVAEVIDGDNR